MSQFHELEEEIGHLLNFYNGVQKFLETRKSWAALLERKTQAITSYTICLFGENNTDNGNTSEHYSIWGVLEISAKDFTVSLQKILPIDSSFTFIKSFTFEQFLNKSFGVKYIDAYKFIHRKNKLETNLPEKVINNSNQDKKLKL